MKAFLALALLISSSTSFAVQDACKRSPQVVAAFEAEFKKSCSQISESDLARLQKLSLEDAGLTTLRPEDFAGLTALKALNLMHNRFEIIPSAPFANLSQLEELNLAHSSIHLFTPGFFLNLPNLKVLDLGYNPFGELPEDLFKGLRHLKILNLSGLPLSSYHFLNGMTSLEELSMWECDLWALTDLFRGLTSLKVFYAGQNYIQQIDALQTFDGMPALEHLDLSGNHLMRIDNRAFEKLSNLRSLSLAYNRYLTEIPEKTFFGLQKLEELDLSYTNLGTLPPRVFESLFSLKKLDLERSNLTMLPDGVFIFLPMLETLNLQVNYLRDLSPMIFDPRFFSQTATVDLYSNPLTQKDTQLLEEQLKDRWINR